MTKKVLALLLSVLMLIGMFPMSAAAANASDRVKGLTPSDGGGTAVTATAEGDNNAYTVTLTGHVKVSKQNGTDTEACWAGVGIRPPAGYTQDVKVAYNLSTTGEAGSSFTNNNGSGTLDDIQGNEQGFYIWIDVDKKTTGNVVLSLKWTATDQSELSETYTFVWGSELTFCTCNGTGGCKCENSTCECTKCDCAECKAKEEEDEISYVEITPSDRVVKLANALGVVGVQTADLSFDAASSVNTVAITARAKPSMSAEEIAQNLPWFGVGIIAPEGMTKLETYTGNAKAATGQVTYNKYTADDPALELDWMQAEGKYGYGLWLDANDAEETEGFVKTLKWTDKDGKKTVYEIVKFTWEAEVENTEIALGEVGFAADAAAAESGIKTAVAKVNKNFKLPDNDVAPNTMWATFSLDGTPDGDLKITFKNGDKEYVETIEASKVSKNSTGGVAYVSFDDQAKSIFESGKIGGEYTISATINNRPAAETKTLKIYEVIKNYNDEGATPNATELSTGETAPTKPAETPTREGYTFDGWGEGVPSIGGYTITFTAQWEPIGDDGCKCPDCKEDCDGNCTDCDQKCECEDCPSNQPGCTCPGCAEGDEDCNCDGDCSDGECECPNCNPDTPVDPAPDCGCGEGCTCTEEDGCDCEDGCSCPDCPNFVPPEHDTHTWGSVEWGEWTETEDGWTITATRTCQEGGEKQNLEVEVTEEETTPATCETDGETTYSASATVDDATENCPTPKTVEIPALGHEWGEIEWGTWTGTDEDGYTITATRHCTRVGDESTEDTDVEVEVTTDVVEATCTIDGSVTYTATATYGEGETETYEETKVVVIEAIGEHDFVTDPDTGVVGCTQCDYTMSGEIEETVDEEDGTVTQTAVVVAEGVQDISDELKAKDYDTGAAIEADLRDAVDAISGYDSENFALYDVQLLANVDNAGWEMVNIDDVAAINSVTVILPYPDAIDNYTKYDFAVVHMFAHGDNAGAKETFTDKDSNVTPTAVGLKVTLSSLSPIAISWKTKSTGGGTTIVPDDDGDDEPSTEKPAYNNCPKDDTCPIAQFKDTDTTGWYHDAIHFVLDNGLMSGNGDGTFTPDSTLTRAMLVQILYNLEGKPADVGPVSFSDVEATVWYSDAVRWAASHGIVAGNGDGTFSPEAAITREQVAVIFRNYAKNYLGKNVGIAERTDISNFTDAGKASRWAVDALKWAVGTGLISGTTSTTLEPTATATRAQAASILMKYCEKNV